MKIIVSVTPVGARFALNHLVPPDPFLPAGPTCHWSTIHDPSARVRHKDVIDEDVNLGLSR